MSLEAGTRLGPYEIVAPLGAGGMGEVYRARDTRLHRDVAIKVLPAAVADDEHLRERFEREARTIARLSHPHICALFDVGHDGRTTYLVMELIEGETLAGRLEKGPLPLPQLVRYGREIAEALDAAHRQGVVHRDLKPGNVMLTRSGAKVLDFGLARFALPEADGNEIASALPTAGKSITEEGTLVGTLHYMAPEQLEGRPADARSDIFALGATLYEMATGQRPFHGATRASLIASILAAEPRPISSVQPMTPPELERVIRACLEKDPDERWQSAHDVARELLWLQEPRPALPVRGRAWRAIAALILAFAAGAAVAAIALAAFRGEREIQAIHLSLSMPTGARAQHFVVSPDGTKVVLLLREPQGRVRLWVHDLHSGVIRLLERTENATYPFWSPDSRTIAYFANEMLHRIDVGGGAPQTICDAPGGRGGTWNERGTILFSPHSNGPLFTVPAEGGTLRQVTTLDRQRSESTHRWPVFLPDGDRYVYLRSSFGTEARNPRNGLYLASLEGKEERLLVATNSNAAYANGHLLFVREGGLLAQRLDLREGRVIGTPSVLLPEVRYWPQVYWGDFSISPSGVLLSMKGTTSGLQFVWLDEQGRELAATPIRGLVANPRLSPDGSRVAFDMADPRTANGDVWIHDFARGRSQRLTFGPAYDALPIWSSAGQVIYGTYHGNAQLTCARAADGSGAEECLPPEPAGPRLPYDVSPDGQMIVGRVVQPESGPDLLLWDRRDGTRSRLIVHSPAAELDARISRDGKWLAYVSNESGQSEVYVTRFPSGEGKWQISSEGATQPEWTRDGRRLLFLAAGKQLVSVDVTTGTSFDAGPARPLFHAAFADAVSATDRFFYDIAEDGRILIVKDPYAGTTESIDVVVNWTPPRRGLSGP